MHSKLLPHGRMQTKITNNFSIEYSVGNDVVHATVQPTRKTTIAEMVCRSSRQSEEENHS